MNAMYKKKRLELQIESCLGEYLAKTEIDTVARIIARIIHWDIQCLNAPQGLSYDQLQNRHLKEKTV